MGATTSDGFRWSADYVLLRITSDLGRQALLTRKLYGARIMDRRTIDLGYTTHAVAGYWGATLNDG